jgi:restriction system protein
VVRLAALRNCMARNRKRAFHNLLRVFIFLGMLWVWFTYFKPKGLGEIFFAVVCSWVAAYVWAFAFMMLREGRSGKFEVNQSNPRVREEPTSDMTTWQRVVAQASDNPAKPKEWNVALLKRMEWRRFEEICAAYFELVGFTARINDFGADGGIDIKLYASGATAPSIAVQCKAWTSSFVGVDVVRELLGAMADAKITEGILVTSAGFTFDASKLASRNNIALIDGEEFVRKLAKTLTNDQRNRLLERAIEGDFETPTCARCGVKMKLRTSQRGPFWGCINYPRCTSKIFQPTTR